MPTLISPPPNRLNRPVPDFNELERDVRSAAGQEVREAARNGHHFLRTRAVQILKSALERYRRPDGYEGHLVEAAWQLEQMGPEAWPVLRDLVLAGFQECEYFLGAVVRMRTVAPKDHVATLLSAARNTDANVRSRLLELVEEMPRQTREDVLQELTAMDRPDDSVTDRAWQTRQGQGF